MEISPQLTEKIVRLRQLLLMEKEEEQRQYKEFIQNSSINLRRKNGLCWYPLRIIETGYGLGDYPFLVVERNVQQEVPHQFNGGKTIGLFSMSSTDRQEVKGAVHYVDNNKMKLILYSNDFPDWIDDGKLGVDLLFDERSYREMENALDKLLRQDDKRLMELLEVFYGERKPRFEKLKHQVEMPGLNPSQNSAVNEVLASKDVSIIHGPPGTGKTTTLVHAIKELAKTETHILVATPSNAAADHISERLADTGLNVVRVGNLSRIDEKVTSLTVESLLSEHPQSKDIKRLKKQADEYRRMAFKYKRQFGKAERDQRKLLQKEAKAIASDAVKLENHLVNEIISNAQVITCTLVSTMNRYIEEQKFDTVIIDEAAQALEPACWIAISKAKGRVVLAGDPFQLPPTVKSEIAARAGLNITLMEKGLKTLHHNSLLNEQYRMNETIMGFSNQWFYKGKLMAADSVKNHSLAQEQPLEFIDTAGCSFDENLDPETVSFNNPGEAGLLKKHLLNLLANVKEEFSCGVISPYREQVITLKEELSELIEENKNISINTIDSFQGQERDVIYISLVRSNPNGEIGFLSDYRRMNVAMTRARKKLVIIGDSATLGKNDFYNAFFDYVEKNNAYRSAWELLPL